MYDYTIELAGNTMLSCFFGRELKDEKIEGDNVFVFLKKLFAGLIGQNNDPLYGMLGVKFLERGMR